MVFYYEIQLEVFDDNFVTMSRSTIFNLLDLKKNRSKAGMHFKGPFAVAASCRKYNRAGLAKREGGRLKFCRSLVRIRESAQPVLLHIRGELPHFCSTVS